MEWKLGYGSIGLIALLLSGGLIAYEVHSAPTEIPMQISFSSAPVLDPYPELAGLKIHLNTASAKDLEQLPNIGATKAKAIHDYIRLYGKIVRPEELLEIDGIGEKLLEQILPYLVFN